MKETTKLSDAVTLRIGEYIVIHNDDWSGEVHFLHEILEGVKSQQTIPALVILAVAKAIADSGAIGKITIPCIAEQFNPGGWEECQKFKTPLEAFVWLCREAHENLRIRIRSQTGMTVYPRDLEAPGGSLGLKSDGGKTKSPNVKNLEITNEKHDNS